MDILTRTISLVLRKRLKEIERFGDEADQIQDKQLRMLLDKAKGTLWGQAYDYKSIRTYADYRERVPIQTYDDLKPYINRMIKGERNVLWPGHQPSNGTPKAVGQQATRANSCPSPTRSCTGAITKEDMTR